MSIKERKLVGYNNFIRSNPNSDKFEMIKFHSIEYYCSDSLNFSSRFSFGLGLKKVAISDLSTGNNLYSSVVLKSNDVTFVFTAPYHMNHEVEKNNEIKSIPHPNYSQEFAFEFIKNHGLAVRAVGILVKDAKIAHDISVSNGAISVLPPTELYDEKKSSVMLISEIRLYGDTVIRWISGNSNCNFLPNYKELSTSEVNLSLGLLRVDHIVGNVPKLFDAVDYLMNAIGFHEFSEFTAEDIGTIDSGLNSMVLASNNEMILLPVNEPTFGTRRKSQIQTYLEYNNGPGVQHIAIKTENILITIAEMRKRSSYGGFEFMPSPSPDYYNKIKERLELDKYMESDHISELQEMLKALGILIDRDDQGILLQLFTKPLGDRPTIFIEIIQRIGCDGVVTLFDELKKFVTMGHSNTCSTCDSLDTQTAGCGGFGKGNFSELFKSIEVEFEKL